MENDLLGKMVYVIYIDGYLNNYSNCIKIIKGKVIEKSTRVSNLNKGTTYNTYTVEYYKNMPFLDKTSIEVSEKNIYEGKDQFVNAISKNANEIYNNICNLTI